MIPDSSAQRPSPRPSSSPSHPSDRAGSKAKSEGWTSSLVQGGRPRSKAGVGPVDLIVPYPPIFEPPNLSRPTNPAQPTHTTTTTSTTTTTTKIAARPRTDPLYSPTIDRLRTDHLQSYARIPPIRRSNLGGEFVLGEVPGWMKVRARGGGTGGNEGCKGLVVEDGLEGLRCAQGVEASGTLAGDAFDRGRDETRMAIWSRDSTIATLPSKRSGTSTPSSPNPRSEMTTVKKNTHDATQIPAPTLLGRHQGPVEPGRIRSKYWEYDDWREFDVTDYAPSLDGPQLGCTHAATITAATTTATATALRPIPTGNTMIVESIELTADRGRTNKRKRLNKVEHPFREFTSDSTNPYNPSAQAIERGDDLDISGRKRIRLDLGSSDRGAGDGTKKPLLGTTSGSGLSRSRASRAAQNGRGAQQGDDYTLGQGPAETAASFCSTTETALPPHPTPSSLLPQRVQATREEPDNRTIRRPPRPFQIQREHTQMHMQLRSAANRARVTLAAGTMY